MVRAAPALLFLSLLLPLTARAETMVRIAVAEGLPSVEVRAEGMRARPLGVDADYQPVDGPVARLRHLADRVSLEGRNEIAKAIKVRADGPISVSGKTVRGSVEILWAEKGLLVINEIPMEAYLAAVLGSEMPPSFPPEALKAQAVAARTYAIGKKIAAEGQPFHLGASVLSQVYGGVHREDPRTHAAVKATQGQVLVHEHAPIEAYFFSSCGGQTESGAEALSRALPYLVPHACPERPDTPGAHWSLQLSSAELGRRLGLPPITSIEITSKTATGRARSVALRSAKGRHPLDAVTLRRRLGYSDLKSLAFTVQPAAGGFRFQGKGSGHGAGMCQWGASAAAANGLDFAKILELYYPGTELRHMY